MPHQCRYANRIIGADSIVVDRKSGATLTVREFAVSDLASEPTWVAVKCENFLEEQPQTPLNASALCAEVSTNIRSVPMLCPSIDGVLATPLPGIQADRLVCLVKLLAHSQRVFNRSLSVKLGIFPISCRHWHPIISL